jgi:DNA-binding MarR family transcriptional regulator
MPWLPFEWDVNHDGQLTISDVGLWLQQMYFLPGDLVIWGMLQYWPEASQFLELTVADYGSSASALISVLCWLIVAIVVLVATHYLAALDRAVTRIVRNSAARTLLRGRVAKNRCIAAARRFRQRLDPSRHEKGIVELSAAELRVLSAHSHVSPPATLALSDLVRATGVPRNQVKDILQRLEELELLNAAEGNETGAESKGYALTKPGRDYLTVNSLTLSA